MSFLNIAFGVNLRGASKVKAIDEAGELVELSMDAIKALRGFAQGYQLSVLAVLDAQEYCLRHCRLTVVICSFF